MNIENFKKAVLVSFRNKEKKLVIEERINKLYENLQLLFNYNKDVTVIYAMGYNTVKAYQLKIETTYGIRYLIVTNDRIIYSTPLLKEYMESYISYGSLFSDSVSTYSKVLFDIQVKDGKVTIYPKPMTKFTPEEIDLAILEFEEYIKPILKEVEEEKAIHQKCINYFSKEV